MGDILAMIRPQTLSGFPAGRTRRKRRATAGAATALATALLLCPGPARAQSDPEAEMERAAEALSGFLERLKEKAKKLPDRTLGGVVRFHWPLDQDHENGYVRGYCSAFALLELDPHSLESYPRGQWTGSDGFVIAQSRKESFHENDYRADVWMEWEGSGAVGGHAEISTFDDGTYRISFSSRPVMVRVRIETEGVGVERLKERQCALSMTVEGLPLPQPDQPFAGRHRDPRSGREMSWEFWPNPCKRGEAAPWLSQPAPPEPTGRAKMVQEAVAAALRARGLDVTPGYIRASQPGESGRFIQYHFRVARDTCILPGVRDILLQCIRPGSQEGALHLALGAIQQYGGRTRATIRMVEVETGLITKTGKGDAEGTDVKAMATALGRAMDAMGQEFACVRGVNK